MSRWAAVQHSASQASLRPVLEFPPSLPPVVSALAVRVPSGALQQLLLQLALSRVFIHCLLAGFSRA